jgi:hypothetical protein
MVGAPLGSRRWPTNFLRWSRLAIDCRALGQQQGAAPSQNTSGSAITRSSGVPLQTYVERLPNPIGESTTASVAEVLDAV